MGVLRFRLQARLSWLPILTGLFLGTARAQSQPSWVFLDNQAPGAPAEIVFDANSSNTNESVFDVYIHGFWVTLRQGPDNLVYQQIEVPGLRVVQTIGAPELPIYPFDLGVVTGNSQVTLATATVISQVVLPNYLPWPHPVPAVPSVPGVPEQFAKDMAIYGSSADFPVTGGVGGPTTGIAGTLRAGPGEIYPIFWNPSGALTVLTHVRYAFSHSGTPAQAEVGSAMAATSALGRLLNAAAVQPWVHWNSISYPGYYLFIFPAADETQLAPLITQKEKRGYLVTTAHVEDIGSTCAAMRSYIDGWYAGTIPGGVHFCLLVGDVDVIPLCTAPPPSTGDPAFLTDDLYGDADGDGIDDLGKEIFVGRLSIVDATDLTQEITRILNYEDHPTPFQDYDTAALIAYHRGGVGGAGFEDAQEKIRTAAYTSVTPNFETVYGESPGITNGAIDSVASRDGILVYAGHGNQTSWGGWNKAGQDYGIAEVDALVSHPVTPIIWSLTCLTGSIQTSDCVAEGWMFQNTDGAVSFYGGTDLTGIGGNLFLETALFDAVFNKGITTQGVVLEYGEARGKDSWNSYKYLLLGDPEMRIRRHNVPDPFRTVWDVDKPPVFAAGAGGSLDVRVRTPQGVPVPGVLIALWKGTPGGGDAVQPERPLQLVPELQVNRYSGQDGYAHFQLPPLNPGTLYLTLTDDEANVVSDSITVIQTTGIAEAMGASNHLLASPSITRAGSRIAFGRPLEADATLVIVDVAGREIQRFPVAKSMTSVLWPGTTTRGVPVPAGLYLAHLAQVPARGTARIFVVR